MRQKRISVDIAFPITPETSDSDGSESDSEDAAAAAGEETAKKAKKKEKEKEKEKEKDKKTTEPRLETSPSTKGLSGFESLALDESAQDLADIPPSTSKGVTSNGGFGNFSFFTKPNKPKKKAKEEWFVGKASTCLLYTSPSPRD